MKEILPLTMSTLLRGHRVDDTHLVADLGSLRKILGNLKIT
jgi:hypothetical protein